MTVGFIGQGYIGKNYADDFENRGYKIVRYALEEPYNRNADDISKCDLVFIAVPTPTTTDGFDSSIIESALSLVGNGKTAVIKSTILPGTTESLQGKFPNIFVLNSPEFLTEATAGYDAANPDRNIVGIPKNTNEYKKMAKEVIDVLPKAPYKKICSAREAELTKYGGNCWFYYKVIFINMLYDLAKEQNADWDTIQENMTADSRIGATHLSPVHKSGRGAGGNCFIKDFAAFRELYERTFPDDEQGLSFLKAAEMKNKELLVQSGKDLELLHGVYGKEES